MLALQMGPDSFGRGNNGTLGQQHHETSCKAVGADNLVTLCNLGILVDEPTESITSEHLRKGRSSGRRCRTKRGCLAQCAMWPMRHCCI
jgi:hypothetical protein